MTTTTTAPKHYSLRTAGDALGVSHETVRQMVLDKRLPTVELPGVRRKVIPAWAIEKLIPKPP